MSWELRQKQQDLQQTWGGENESTNSIKFFLSYTGEDQLRKWLKCNGCLMVLDQQKRRDGLARNNCHFTEPGIIS